MIQVSKDTYAAVIHLVSANVCIKLLVPFVTVLLLAGRPLSTAHAEPLFYTLHFEVFCITLRFEVFFVMQDVPVSPSSPSAGAASPQGDPSAPPSIAEGALAEPSKTSHQQQWAPDMEESEEEEEENVGQWSPEPLDPRLVGTQDVIHEDDDLRMLTLLRAQVRQHG